MQKSYNEAAQKLKDERATLTRFDDELKELDVTVRTKKEAVADADANLKKLEHDVQVLSKEQTAAMNAVAHLQQQNEWIIQDSQYVIWLSFL